MQKYFLLFIGLILGVVGNTRAQARVQRSGAFWPELQAEYVFKSTSFLYFRNQYRHNFDQDFNNLSEDGPLKYLERAQFRGGFEHMFSPHWSGGFAEAYAAERTRKILFNEIFLRHLSRLGAYQFTKRGSFEHIVQWGRENYARFRLRADLDRNIAWGKIKLRPRVSYELFFNRDYNPDPVLEDKLRLVDRARLRAEITYPFTEHISAIPFFTRQTDYFMVEPSYDAAGSVIRRGGNQNHITPILGLDLRYTFFKGGKAIPRTIQINR